MPAAAKTASVSASRRARSATVSAAGAEDGGKGRAEVADQLVVLPAHHLLLDLATEAARRQVRGDGVDQLVGALGVAAEHQRTAPVGVVVEHEARVRRRRSRPAPLRRRRARSGAAPCARSRRRSAVQTTGRPAPPARRSSSRASAQSCVFIVRKTTSSSRKSTSPGPATAGMRSCSVSTGLFTVSPRSRMASRCGPAGDQDLPRARRRRAARRCAQPMPPAP